MNKESIIYVAGHKGMVGSALLRKLEKEGFLNIIVANSSELDLRSSSDVDSFLKRNKPEYVFLCAAKVGGIQANVDSPAEFLYDNVMIQTNLIHLSWQNNIKKLLVLGSSCIYPKECKQPMKEDYLLSGKLEPTNEGYALSKILALKQAEYYKKQYGFNAISVMPPNLYGPNDNFDPVKSHVLAALVKRFVDAVNNGADSVTMWGTGIARREFMHVDDLADVLIFLMNHYDSEKFINVGWGTDVSIKELAELIIQETGYRGKINWDSSKPDGMLKKCMDVTRMKEVGYTPEISLEQGVRMMIEEYKNIEKTGKTDI